MDKLAFCSATELAAKIANGENSAVDLCDFFINRIERYDNGINAVVVRDFDRARDAARLADNVAHSERGCLHGVPITIKESFDVAGLPTTWGLPQFQGSSAAQDASVVQNLKSAGAILLGKTNVPANLADFQSYNKVYGVSNNPWNVERTPGGSSGGAAAALAAGMTALEIGSDIGGSIRNPAHYCGVYGHKPTWGIVPQNGHALPGALASSDLAVCGPLARSAEDLALALNVIAEAPSLNKPGWKLTLPPPRHRQLKDFRVAVWASDSMAPVDDEIKHRIDNTAATLEQCGAKVSYDARPSLDIKRSHTTYVNLLQSIMGAALGSEFYESTRQTVALLDAGDQSDTALTMRSMVLDHRSWLRANNFRERLRYQWREFFKGWDIILCPVMATTAFGHDHSKTSERKIMVNSEPQDYFKQVFWAGLGSTSYLPSTVFPSGLSSGGLPIGIQAMSAEYNDFTTIEFARLLTAEIGGCNTPPNFA